MTVQKSHKSKSKKTISISRTKIMNILRTNKQKDLGTQVQLKKVTKFIRHFL